MRRIGFSLAIVVMLVMTALLVTNLPPAGGQPAAWPATWIGLNITDPSEGGCDGHRNVFDTNSDGSAVYYATDSHYLYLRMETVSSPGWPSTGSSGKARYKWYLSTAGTAAYIQGGSAYGAEFLLMLEDLTNNSNDPTMTRDQLGELTLMDDLGNAGFTARWDSANPPHYTTNSAQTSPTGNSSWWRRVLGTDTPGTGGPQGVMDSDIGYRINDAGTGGCFVDMYVSWAALGNPSSLCILWGTDNQNTNLDQEATCDRPTSDNCVPLCVPPRADFYASNTTTCVNRAVAFTSNSTGNATSWNWTFTGGTPSSATGVGPHNVTYASPGNYTVSLTVSNACGSNTTTKANYMTVYAGPAASASSNSPVCQGATIELYGGPSGMISYNWTGPGGWTSSAQNSTRSNAATNMTGTYTLTVTNSNGCTAANSTSVTVNAKPAVTASSNSPVCEGATVELYGGPSGMTTYNWTGPGGWTSSAQNATRSNATTGMSGTYTLTATNSNGCTATNTTSVTVNPRPTANFSANVTSGCEPLTLLFTDSSTGSPLSWNWTFPGGNPSSVTGQGPHTVTYNNPGTYSVTLTVSNTCGSNTTTKTDYITVNAKPVANFSANVTGGAAPLAVNFTDQSTGNPTGWSWSFPGGNPSSANTQGPHTVTYNSPGTYNVTLTVGNTCGSNITIKIDYITVAVPDIDVSPTPYDFGTITVGLNSTQLFTVSNMGTANLTVGTITITGANSNQFSKQNDNVSGQTITPGGNATLQVVFSPTSVGPKSATLNITSNDPDENPFLVPLSGNGSAVPVPDIDVTPTPYDFGTITVGLNSTQLFTVSNAGTANLTVGTITITGANSNQFSKQNDNVSGQTITPGGNATLQVVFSPTSVGLKSATLNITSNDPDENPFLVPLSGTGTSAPAGPVGEATDSGGSPKNEFTTSEKIYAAGTGFAANASVDIYVVSATDCCCTDSNCTCLEYGANLTALDVSGGAETATINTDGSLPTTAVWGTTAGEYALIFDVDQNGLYDEGDLCCGFTIIATPPVGGTAYPINNLIILTPWIALAAAAAIGIAILPRRRRAQS